MRLWRETGPRLCKQNGPHFLLGQRVERERAMRFSDPETKHGSWRRMQEEKGREGWGVMAEEEPFPSQLRLHFLCGEEVPGWAHGDLILGSETLPPCRTAAL